MGLELRSAMKELESMKLMTQVSWSSLLAAATISVGRWLDGESGLIESTFPLLLIGGIGVLVGEILRAILKQLVAIRERLATYDNSRDVEEID